MKKETMRVTKKMIKVVEKKNKVGVKMKKPSYTWYKLW